MSRITLTESTPSGTLLNTYVLTPSPQGHQRRTGEPSSSDRIDIIPPQPTAPTSQPSGKGTHDIWKPSSRLSALVQPLLAPFLPVGYPDSVSPDYTAYQLYDSLQAIFSSIASLLASRAVLTTLGVGSATATTSLAIYLSILQSTISNISSILFAHRFSTSIAADVRFYRFFADIVNDLAFVLDVLSPSLPETLRIPVLCVASACRSICGVSGGASKAVLSSHFAVRGNIGEVNAKDGSQETVVNLVGMWIGGAVVGRIEGMVATWCWLLILLSGHLWANWMAVRSVRLRTLNAGRASMVVERCIEGRDCDIDVIGRDERLFGRRDEIRSRGRVMGRWVFGGIEELLRLAGWTVHSGGRSYLGDATKLRDLLEIFEAEDYLLWYNRDARRCVMVLKATEEVVAGCNTHLKAMCHAWLIASVVESDGEKASEMDLARRTLHLLETTWPVCLASVKRGGWDLESSSIENETGVRFHAQIE